MSSFVGRIQKLASETAIYGVSSILGRMITFVLFPFYAQVFPPDLYGIVSLVFTAFIFLNIAYQYGMESAYLKFASVSRTAEERQDTFSTATWSLLGTSVVLSGVLLLFRDTVAAWIQIGAVWSHLFFLAVPILVLDALTIVPFAELRLQNRPWRFAVIRLLGIGVNVGLNLLLILVFGFGIEAVFMAGVAASATALVLLLPTYRTSLRLRFEAGLWRTLLGFGLPFLPSGLAWAVTERVNAFFLGGLPKDRVLALYGDQMDLSTLAGAPDEAYSTYIVGVFNGAWKLAIFMTLVVQMFRYAWQPFFLQHAADDDARPLFARIFTLFTAAALLIVLAVSFFAQELVAIPLPGRGPLIPPAYWMGLVVVPIALVGYVFQGWYFNFAAGVYIEKQTKYLVHCALAGSAVALLINVTMVPRYGMLAASWAVTAAFAVMAGMLYFIVRRFYRVPYAWGPVFRMAILAGLIFAAWYAVPALQVWWIEGSLLAAYLAGLLGLRIVSPERLRGLLRRLRPGV